MAVAPFGSRLRAAMDSRGPLCLGIDPHPSLLADWGLPDTVDGLRDFCFTVLEAAGGRVAALKPQSAFFERFGAAGVAVLEDVARACRSLDSLCILDAKRGDIGSTMAGYGSAYLLPGAPLAVDAITLSPYLGFGSLAPAIEMALAHGRGVFVLCLTSNPEGAAVQHAVGSVSGLTVAAEIAAAAAEINQRALADDAADPRASWARVEAQAPLTIRPRRSDRWAEVARPASPMGPVGLVVGATVGSAVRDAGVNLAGLDGPILAPGIGAQGAGSDELRAVFGSALPNVLASSSREILSAGPDVASLRAAIASTMRELAPLRH